MKHPAFLACLTISIAIVISVLALANALTSFGKSMERAAALSRENIPSSITLRTPDLKLDTINFRISNGPGGGESFRLETSDKPEVEKAATPSALAE